MADNSKIEWTDASWNPIRAKAWEIQNDGSGKERIGWHCEHVSEGCRNCYAEGFNRRLGTGRDFKPGELFREDRVDFNNGEVKVFLDEQMLTQPLRWKKPRKIFVGSMTDVFADFVTDEMLDKMFAVMALCPQHTFQVLTKRAARMNAYVSMARAHPVGLEAFAITMDDHIRNASSEVGKGTILQGDIVHLKNWPLPNVWLGVSAERQEEASERIPLLLQTPARTRFISAEPLLGEIRLKSLWHAESKQWFNALAGYAENCAGRKRIGKLDLVIVGGESGRHARSMHPVWPCMLRDDCALAGTAFFFKQWGEWAPSTPSEAKDNPHSGWQANAAHPHVAKAAELYPEAGAKFVARVGKKAAGRLLDGVEHNAFPKVPA